MRAYRRFVSACCIAAIVFGGCNRGEEARIPAPTVTERAASQRTVETDAATQPARIDADSNADTTTSNASDEPRTESGIPDVVESKPIALQPAREANQRSQAVVGLEQLPVTRNDRLLAIQSIVPAYPRDFEIGALFDPGMSGDANAMVRKADQLITEIAKGTLTTNTVHSGSVEHITRSLRPHLDARLEIQAGRYGVPVVDDARGILPVRLFGARGHAIGNFIFTLEGNQWYVADVLVDLRHISVPRARRESPYDPTKAGGRR